MVLLEGLGTLKNSVISSGLEPVTFQLVAPKHQLTITGLHGIIFQKTELFIVTNVRILYSTYSVSWPRVKPGTSQIQVRKITV
jgi:hypothetical protein